MQDLSQYKKKEFIEISNRYVSLLAVGSVAVVALVFTLGLLLGSRRDIPKKTCVEPDLLTRLNQESGEPEPPKEIRDYSYHDTLKAKVDNVPTPASIQPVNSVDGPEGIGDRSEISEIDSVPLMRPVAREDAILESLKEGDAGVYTLQVGSFDDQREASLMVNKLERAGHRAFLISVQLPDDRGIWYRVRVGPFKSKKTAWNYKRTFEEKERLPAFVVKKRG